jgi:hypothetical protein
MGAAPPTSDVSWLVCGAAVFVWASPARYLWASPGRPWYLPFALWLLTIVLARLCLRRRAP